MRTLALAIAMAAMGACNDRGAVPPPPPTAIAPPPPVSAPPPPPVVEHDAAESDAVAAPAKPSCPATPWVSYGHDPARTSVSEGCVDGALAITWKLTRQGPCGYKFRAGKILHIVGEENALFAAVDCGGSPAVMRVTADGAPLWTFSRADYARGSWPAIAGDSILSTDDGVFLVERETGKWHGRELDVWGEPLVVGDVFYVDNTFQADGAGPFVGAVDASFKWKWKASVVSPGKNPKVPKTGGIAYANGLIVHAAAMGPRMVPSLAAHDAATGDRRWLAAATWPESAPSIAADRVFTVERWIGQNVDRLVARALSDGSVQWSETVPWVRGPAPVVTDKLVILHGGEGVRAHDRQTGALVWTNPTPRKAATEVSATTMAGASGSSTLVVTSGPRLHVLRLDDGTETWSDAIVSGSTQAGTVATIERPVVIGRAVYVTSDGTLFRLDPPR